MENRFLIGAIGLTTVLTLSVGVAVAFKTPQPNSEPVTLIEKSSIVNEDIATTTTSTTTTIIPAATTSIKITTTTAKQLPSTTIKSQVSTTVKIVKPQEPVITTTTVIDKKAAMLNWWKTSGVATDWANVQRDYYSSCKNVVQCNKFRDNSNKLSGDFVGLKNYDWDTYYNVQTAFGDFMGASAQDYNCAVNGPQDRDCDKANEDVVDTYMRLVATLQKSGFPVVMS